MASTVSCQRVFQWREIHQVTGRRPMAVDVMCDWDHNTRVKWVPATLPMSTDENRNVIDTSGASLSFARITFRDEIRTYYMP